MKRTMVITFLVFAVSSFALAQEKDKPAQVKKDDHQMHQSGKVEQELMQLERDLAKAAISRDTAMIERVTADDFTFTAPDGTVVTKAQDIADLKAGDFKAESIDLQEMKVRVYGDAAVVTGRATLKATYKGQDISGQYRFTDTFVRRGGQWQIVAAHSSRIGQQ